MAITLTTGNRGETYVSLAVSGVAGGATALEWQYATRRDFQFCIAPMFTTAIGAIDAGFLNRSQTYWWRVREVLSGGARGSWSNKVGASTSTGTDLILLPTVQIRPVLLVVPQRMSLWTAPNSVAGFPPSNLEVPTPAAGWRSTLNGSAFVFAVETSGAPVDTIALLDTNLPEGATVRFLAGPTLAAATNASQATVQTPPVPFRASPGLRGRRGYHGLYRLTTPITDRFISVIIEGSRPPGDVAHITHAVFGLGRLIKNYSDMTDQPTDLGTFERQRDGSPDAVPGFRMRKVDFTVSVMTETQHETMFADLGQLVGTNEPILAVPNTREGLYLHDRILYGNLTQNRQTNGNMRFERQLGIDSIIN